MRIIENLNFNWLFSETFDEKHLEDFRDQSGFVLVDIPHPGHVRPFNYLDEPPVFGPCTYVKIINVKKEFEGRIVQIRFEGVAHAADVYLNGKFVLRHEGGYTEFTADLSAFLKFGEDNYLTVVADDSENPNIPPFGGFADFLGYGGIYREVQMEILEPEHLNDLVVKSFGINQGFSVAASASGEDGEIMVELRDGSDLKFQNRYPMKDGKAFAECLVTDLHLWDINDPHLYDIKVTLIKDGEDKDEKTIRFGFRKAEFAKNGFYLNNQPLKLRGLNRHQSFPYVGYAMPKSAQIKDADILKYDLGVNIVRTSHYPVSRHFLDRCDEIGLLVFEEIPGWQHIGEDQFRTNVLKDVASMIERDRHHPSIILWGVRINESDDCEPLYKTANALAKNLDDTRQTGGVRCIKHSQFFEDVYTYNDFTNAGGKAVLEKPNRVKKNVPYLVTEHNGHMFPTKKYDDEPHWLEQALRHYRVIEAAAKDPNISGTIGWCMNDYNTHNEFGSGDKICYHGVLDMFRLFKPAGYVYASQGDAKPVLEVLTSLNSGEYPGSLQKQAVLATNCDLVKVYKDGRFIGDHHPNPKSALSHPLIIITDFIGSLLEEDEKMSHRDAEFVKKLLRKIKNEDVFPLNLKVGMLYILRKYHYTLQAATGLYFKYTKSGNEWRFVGYQNGQPVKTVIKGKQSSTAYQMSADSQILRVGATYDVTRIVVRKVDQNQNVLDYAFEGAMIQTEGGIDLIGPNLASLVGGEMAFWVRTNGKGPTGNIKVTVGNQELTKQVKIGVE